MPPMRSASARLRPRDGSHDTQSCAADEVISECWVWRVSGWRVFCVPESSLGGILGGVFTPTEAASVAVFYGLFLAFVVYRSITLSQFLGIFRTTIELSGMVLLVIGMGSMPGYALTIFQVPHERLLDAFAPGKILFLLFVQISFYIIGTCMDTLPLC
jgi:C4-dicarboxylate transporter DctM subunit